MHAVFFPKHEWRCLQVTATYFQNPRSVLTYSHRSQVAFKCSPHDRQILVMKKAHELNMNWKEEFLVTCLLIAALLVFPPRRKKTMGAEIDGFILWCYTLAIYCLPYQLQNMLNDVILNLDRSLEDVFALGHSIWANLSQRGDCFAQLLNWGPLESKRFLFLQYTYLLDRWTGKVIWNHFSEGATAVLLDTSKIFTFMP